MHMYDIATVLHTLVKSKRHENICRCVIIIMKLDYALGKC